MPRFFIEPDQVTELPDGTLTLRILGQDARHIGGSLRLRPGDALVACDMRGAVYDCTIASLTDAGQVLCDVSAIREADNEPSVDITVYQALTKGDKFDYIVQKAVELGAGAIVPVRSGNCVAELPAARLQSRLQRWNRIAAEAAKQCGRSKIVQVTAPVAYSEMLGTFSAAPCAFICYEGARGSPISAYLSGIDLRAARSVSFFIGPEGGLTAAEVQAAEAKQLPLVGLGGRILRTETAGGLALAALLYACGDI